jgi:hypothetical protein
MIIPLLQDVAERRGIAKNLLLASSRQPEACRVITQERTRAFAGLGF